MRIAVLAALLYLLVIVQAGLLPVGPDLVLLLLVVAALHEHRLTATALGVFAGLCLDLTTPGLLGTGMLALGGIGYGVAAVRDIFYRVRWFIVLFTLAAVVIRYGLLALAGTRFTHPLYLLLTAALTLGLSPFADRFLTLVFYRQWKSG